MTKVTKMPRAEQWADQICSELGKSVESTIEVGRLLKKAKDDLGHGEWGRLFDDGLLPFGQEMARLYMRVAANPLLTNSKHVWNLPPAVSTLAKLADADQAKLKNALKDGVIRPDMPRKAVKALLPPARKRERAVSSSRTDETSTDLQVQVVVPIASWSDEAEANSVRDALRPARTLVDDWPEGRSYELFIHEVRQLLKYLERLEGQRNAVSA